MAGPIHQPPSRTSSLRFAENTRSCINTPDFQVSVLHDRLESFSRRRSSWKPRRSTRAPELGSTARDMGIRKFDGAARRSSDWDGLRRDPDLWFPEGNCLVHLYGRGQSRRGPAFRVPLEALLASNCHHLLDRFLVHHSVDSPLSDITTSDEGGYFGQPNSGGLYELYIPAPPTAERGQAFLYHSTTRNFFAWIFGKSLVGSHLGGALVGLLNSMNEFRSLGVNNVQDVVDYMDEEGYADMRNSPDQPWEFFSLQSTSDSKICGLMLLPTALVCTIDLLQALASSSLPELLGLLLHGPEWKWTCD